MRYRLSCMALLIVLGVLPAAVGVAEVQWEIVNTLKLESAPRDAAVTLDGKTIYVLTEKGEILVYDSDGALKAKISVGPHADSLKVAQDGERLFVLSRAKKTLEVIELDFVRNIDTSGAPFKGPKDAPVVVAVFSDFQ